jgi:hypothetical protein
MRNLAVVASLAAVALVNSAMAELLTFDHLPRTSGSQLPSGLGEFEWSADFDYVTGAFLGGGYANGVVSPPNVAYNAFGGNAAFGRSMPFELDSFYLTAAWRTGLNVTVIGKLDGAVVDKTTLTVNTSSPTLETFDWDVNEVVFHSFGGTNAGLGGNGYQFALDDLSTSAVTKSSAEFVSFSVPESSTWAMMLLGFAGLGIAYALGGRGPLPARAKDGAGPTSLTALCRRAWRIAKTRKLCRLPLSRF